MPFFTLYQAIIKMQKGGNRHRSKGGPKWASFHQFWVAIPSKFMTNRLRIIIQQKKLQYFCRQTSFYKILGIAILQRRKKIIESGKVWNKRCWKWLKLLFQIFIFFDEIWKMEQFWPKNDQKRWFWPIFKIM